MTAVAVVIPGGASADTIYWDGTNNALWSDVTAWSTSSSATTPNPASVPGSADDVWFNISTVNSALTAYLNGAQAANSLTFRSTGATSLLSGAAANSGIQTLSLGSGGVTVNAGAGATTLGNAANPIAFALTASQTWANNSANALSATGSFAGSAASGTQSFTISGSGNTTLSGAISNGTAGGALGLIKVGSGTLTLNGASTFSGATLVDRGTLSVNGVSGALLNTNSVLVRNNASLTLGDSSNTGGDRIHDAATVTLDRGNLTLQGRNTATTTETIGTLTIGGGGQSVVTVTPGTSGTARLTLNSITRSGTGGTARFNNTGTILTSQTNTNGILGGWAIWNGGGNGVEGSAVIVSGGTLSYLTAYDKTYGPGSTTGVNDWTGTQNVLMSASASVTLSANQSVNSLTFQYTAGLGTLNLGGRTLQVTSGGVFGTQGGSAGTLTIQSGTLTAGDGSAPASLFFTGAFQHNSGVTTVSTAIVDNNGQAVSVVRGGASSTLAGLYLTGNNSYSGGTYLNFGGSVLSGTANNWSGLRIDNDSNLGSAGGVVYFQGGGLQIRSSGTLNASRDLVVASAANTAMIDTYYGASSGYSVTVAGKITGDGGFSKSSNVPGSAGSDTGALGGTLILTNTGNNWAGTTTVSGGVLQIGNGIDSNGSIPDRTISMTGSNTILRFANPTDFTFNSAILGGGQLAKTGAGTLTLGGTNTHNNGTIISAGVLAISSDAALGAAYDGSLSSLEVTSIGSLDTTTGVTIAAPANGSTAIATATTGYVLSSNNQLVRLNLTFGGSGYVAPPAVTITGTTTNKGTGIAYVKGLLTLDGGTLRTLAGISSSRAVYITGSGGTIDTAGNNSTFSGVFNGPGGLTKAGAGTLFLSGNNSYTGMTRISAGVVSIAAASALETTSGVSIANGAGLTYTGGAGTLDRPITVTGGVGTVTNSGAGTLTLSGTLTKNGTVLQLSGGAFNVTGQIVGASENSDLYVNGASVTLSNTNSYNGPTYVFNSGRLALGVSNAIPSDSVVTLGASGSSSATGPGTLDLGTSTNTIAGLAFSGSGNTLKMAANQTAAPQLVTNNVFSPVAGTTLDLAGMGTSAGRYKLVSYTSNTGTFATINGLAAGYQLVYGTTELDAQQKAVLGTVTVTNPVTSIITGGSAAFTYTVANGAASGGASLLFTGSSNSNVAGSSNGSAVAGGLSTSVAGLYFTGTGVGSSQIGTFNVNSPDAYGLTTATGTVSVTVLDHATSSLSSASTPLTAMSISLGQWNYATQTWESGTSAGGFSIYNLASQYGPNLTAELSLLSVTGAENGFTTNLLANYADIAGGHSSQFLISFDPSGLNTSTTQSATFRIQMSDKIGMSGATASNTLYVMASVIVVPEPDTIIFAGIGIALAGWSLWKRRLT